MQCEKCGEILVENAERCENCGIRQSSMEVEPEKTLMQKLMNCEASGKELVQGISILIVLGTMAIFAVHWILSLPLSIPLPASNTAQEQVQELSPRESMRNFLRATRDLDVVEMAYYADVFLVEEMFESSAGVSYSEFVADVGMEEMRDIREDAAVLEMVGSAIRRNFEDVEGALDEYHALIDSISFRELDSDDKKAVIEVRIEGQFMPEVVQMRKEGHRWVVYEWFSF